MTLTMPLGGSLFSPPGRTTQFLAPLMTHCEGLPVHAAKAARSDSEHEPLKKRGRPFATVRRTPGTWNHLLTSTVVVDVSSAMQMYPVGSTSRAAACAPASAVPACAPAQSIATEQDRFFSIAAPHASASCAFAFWATMPPQMSGFPSSASRPSPPKKGTSEFKQMQKSTPPPPDPYVRTGSRTGTTFDMDGRASSGVRLCKKKEPTDCPYDPS